MNCQPIAQQLIDTLHVRVPLEKGSRTNLKKSIQSIVDPRRVVIVVAVVDVDVVVAVVKQPLCNNRNRRRGCSID